MDPVLVVFLIAAIGCIIGIVRIKGVQFGVSAVLLVSLAFGHFGLIAPPLVRDLGLVFFVCSVALAAGPLFFRNLKKGAVSYLIMSASIVFSGALLAFLLSRLFNLPAPLAVGMYNGAMTSTPGLAAALEMDSSPTISVSYGASYIFGVIGVVLFVQIMPVMLNIDIKKEAAAYSHRIRGAEAAPRDSDSAGGPAEPRGLLMFSVVAVSGILLGSLKVGGFSLGVTGGLLIAGILAGQFSHAGWMPLRIPGGSLSVIRDVGLVMFLIGTGTEAGRGVVAIFAEYGATLFVPGVLITAVPLFVGLLAGKLMKMDAVTLFGAICGGMTSTPALGALIASAKNEDVSVHYTSAYPIGLVLMIFTSRLLMRIL